MMRDWMDDKHIPFINYSTAIIFGLIHFINITGGEPLEDTLAQIVVAIGMVAMLGACYIRTGNILLCMLLHTAHDMLNFMLVEVTDSILIHLQYFKYITILSWVMVYSSTPVFIFKNELQTKSKRKLCKNSAIYKIWYNKWGTPYLVQQFCHICFIILCT